MSTNGHSLNEALYASNLWINTRRRGAVEARQEASDTLYTDSDGPSRAQARGIREGRDLLRRIQAAGLDERALLAIRESLP